VYRHYPDDLSLFLACVGHGYEARPPPDIEWWAEIADPEERPRRALTELYGYFADNERLWSNVLRDMPQLPDLERANKQLGTFRLWAHMREILSESWGARGRRRALVGATIGHALEFETWRSLVRRQELDDRTAVELLVSMVRCATR